MLLERLIIIDAQYVCKMIQLVGLVIIDNDNVDDNNSSKKVSRQLPTVLVEMIGGYLLLSPSPPAYRKCELTLNSKSKLLSTFNKK